MLAFAGTTDMAHPDPETLHPRPTLKDLCHMPPRRFVQRRDRSTFIAIGAWAVFLGATLMVDTSADDAVWLHGLWPLMLVIGGTLTFAFAWRLSSFRLRGLSNALLVVGCVGRGAASVLGVWSGTAESVPRGLAEMAMFTMVGFLLYVTWRTRIPQSDSYLID